MTRVQQRVDRLCVKYQPHLACPERTGLISLAAKQAHVPRDFRFILWCVQAASLLGQMVEQLRECLLAPAPVHLRTKRGIHLGGQTLAALGLQGFDEVGIEGDRDLPLGDVSHTRILPTSPQRRMRRWSEVKCGQPFGCARPVAVTAEQFVRDGWHVIGAVDDGHRDVVVLMGLMN